MSKKNLFESINKRLKLYLNRRPHRSFRQTRRRDYDRSFKLPGYLAFTKYVAKTVWLYRRIMILVAVVYAILTLLLVGIASQDTYSTLVNTLQTTGEDVFVGSLGDISKAGLLFMASATGSISQNLTDVQQIYAVLIGLLIWLTTVWLLRNLLAGHRVRLRDGLYNSGSPILSTFLVTLLLIVQLLPLALALIGYSAASATGLLAGGGVESMLFWIATGLLAMLSLYWITSTVFALIIVTLPGIYPMQAIKTAGDLVIGRRLRILLRLIWMAVGIVMTWAVIMIPIILIDIWVKSMWLAINWVPTIPVVLLMLSSLTIVWSSSYIYLLYRKVVTDDTDSA
jgi:hypothetical protein